ncbi:hypothetical protein EXIGLDRAFT_829659 [Exidia glandulosa HHB12029]|uniref:C2H2-type domain-containing protein n=1 Tax=Exidia glandulosa HHB12029 TaxID=1314781 RepID=A0A165PFL3_EXIGL|nr:hypothetical protein EXIGLDRAFT_829659 [Exidia glandulosa HHB12029]
MSSSSQQQQQQQKPPALDWLSFPAPAVVDAPHPDLFDFELDNSLSAFDQAQVQLLTLDYNDSFAFTNYRSETPQGPPSVITASSESAYETLSSYSESLNNYSNSSPGYNGVEPQHPVDLNIDFGQFNPNHINDLNISNLALMDHPRDASVYSGLHGHFDRSAQEYDASYNISATRSTYSNHSGYVPAPGSSTMAPSHMLNPGAHAANSESPKSSSDGGHAVGGDGDPRKKYPCPNCTRSFARAYNLKTHLATHDPHRLKPYVCPHRSCGRSFSRKHDLGRHLVSIHRDETGSQYSVASGHSGTSGRTEESSIRGVGINADNAVRQWCSDCGRGWVGHQRPCACNDVK